MSATPQHFTAAQIARALGKTRQVVQPALASVTPSSAQIVNGRTVNAWLISALPGAMQKEIGVAAALRGCRNAEHLLATASEPWKPSLPLSEIAQHCIDKAAKLQRALARVLAAQTESAVLTAETERLGLADYAREFGSVISGRYLRELVTRTLERAGDAQEFSRLELYLDERPARKITARPAISLAVQDEFRELLEIVGTFKNPGEPSDTEREYLWLRAFELFEEKTSAGTKAKKTKNALVKFLTRNMPWLAENANALRVSFNRKYQRWIESDRAALSLADGRKEKSGNHRAPELCKDDRDLLIAHAVLHCGGRVSQAWRELCQRGSFSGELREYYLSNPASKSHCPTRIRESVKHEIAMMDDIHHGPRTDRLNGAHLIRNWDSVAPMDWLCADDCTLEVYFYVPDEKGWFTLTRGQLLLMIDVRTTRILAYALIPEKTYNARAIRTLITKTCDEHGLPRKGFYFERGIWASSRLLKGNQNETPFSWGEAETGLRALGLKFIHSRLPRSKPVERVLGALQDLMDGEPGFVGGNEMKEKFERVQKRKLEVDARKVHPSKHFYDLDQWIERLDDLCARYNAERQNGKMTGGNSPDDAFAKLNRTDDRPNKLIPQCRYLLSHHKRPVKVTSNGITLRFGKQVFNYRNEATGQLRGQTVLAWFNPETPEILTVTSLNRENPICVERTQEVPAMDAPADLLAQEMGRANEHLSYARTRYRILKARFSAPFRPMFGDATAVRLGTEMEQQEKRATAARSEQQQQQTKARKAFNRVGMNVPADRPLRPGQADAADRLAELLAEEEKE